MSTTYVITIVKEAYQFSQLIATEQGFGILTGTSITLYHSARPSLDCGTCESQCCIYAVSHRVSTPDTVAGT